MERIRPTKSGLFAIELLVAVGVFTVCAVICVGIFVKSEVMSRESADLNRAVTEASSLSECFKASGGELAGTQQIRGGALEGDMLLFYYDEAWLPCAEKPARGFVLTLSLEPGDDALAVCGLVEVRRLAPEETLLSWTVAGLREAAA